MEVEFSTNKSDMQQQDVSQIVESDANLRVDKKDSKKTTEPGESHSKVDDCREDYTSETHYAIHAYG